MTKPRRIALLLLDVMVVAGAISLSFWLRFEGSVPARYLSALVWSLPLVVVVKLPLLAVFRLYWRSWRHAGVREFATVGIACVVGSAVLAAAVFALRGTAPFTSFPRSVLGVDFAFSLIGIGGVRVLGRLLGQPIGRSPQRQVGARNALVIGAGDAGAQLVRAMQEEPGFPYRIVGFIDDDRTRHGMIVRGVRVLGPRRRIPQLVRQWEIESVLIAFPSASRTWCERPSRS